MTRRKFIGKLMTAGSAIVVGASWVARKASPRRFVCAVRIREYPGELKPMKHTFGQGKWSG